MTTDHGGIVLTGEERMLIMERPVARIGDIVRCPRCLGEHHIIEGHELIQVYDRRVAFEGDLTSCGARLISSFSDNVPTIIQNTTHSLSKNLVGTIPIHNSYTGTDNNTSSKLSESDVKPSDLLKLDERAILMRYREAINYMVKHKLRYPGSGYKNAQINNMRGREFGGPYFRCEPQSELVVDWLYDLELNYEWDFFIVDSTIPLTDQPHHYWVEAVAPIGSKVVKMDPLYNETNLKETPPSPNNIMATSPNHDFTKITHPDRYNSSQKLRSRRIAR